jgi:hypothetical protein
LLLLQVSADYAVVKIDLLHEFAKGIKLDVPPDDMTTILRDAVARRVQWRRAGIYIDPADADSVQTTEPQPQSPPLPPTFSEPRPQLPDQWEAFTDLHPPIPTWPHITPPPPVLTEPVTTPKKPSKTNPVRKKQSRPLQRKQILEGKKKVEEIKKTRFRYITLLRIQSTGLERPYLVALSFGEQVNIVWSCTTTAYTMPINSRIS